MEIRRSLVLHISPSKDSIGIKRLVGCRGLVVDFGTRRRAGIGNMQGAHYSIFKGGEARYHRVVKPIHHMNMMYCTCKTDDFDSIP